MCFGGLHMAERITRVILEAEIGRFEQNMDRAAAATKRVKAEGDKLAETHAAMTTLGTAAFAMSAAVAAGVGVAVAKFAEFDQAMSYVAATGDDARGNMEALRQAAIDAGAATVFSATEAANAIEEMAKAGLSAADILGGGLDGALDLAAAGGLEVADAAGIAATALKVFNLEGDDMAHVADLLAAGAGKAMGDVTDLSQALSQGGQVAAATGLTIEETTASLAAFASQGLLGSDAGTSFKTMLQRLTPQSAEAQKKMDELGISAYDATGNFIGMEKFAGNLQTALKDLTPEQRNAALSVMFGSDAVRAANVIYSEGEAGIRDWIDAVNDQGYAAETAATRLDNLMGDWEAFTGALDTAFITMGEGADGPLRGLVQGLTGLVDGFNDLPDGGKQAVLWIGLVTAGVGLLGGGALIAIPKIAALKLALDTLSVSGATTRAGLARFATFLTGPWGIALVAATTAVAGLSAMQDQLRTKTEVFQNVLKNAESVDELFDAGDSAVPFLSRLDEAISSAKVFRENLDIIANNDFLRGLRGETSQLSAVLTTMGEEMAKLAESDAPAAARSFKMLSEEMELSKSEQIDLLNAMKPYRDELVKLADAQGKDVTTKDGQVDMNALLAFALEDSTDATAEATAATEELEAATAEAVGEFEDMVQVLFDVAGATLSMAESHDDALAAVNSLKDAAAAEGATLDGTNTASIGLRDALRDVESAHRDSAAAILENGGTLEDAQAEWDAGREAVIEMMIAMGMHRDEAVAWADQNLGSAAEVTTALGDVATAVNDIPPGKDIKITADTSGATSKLQTLWNGLNDLAGKTWNIPVKTTVDGAGTVLKPPGQATGGPVFGPGTGTSDSVARMLSNGEHVVTAAEVQAAGGHAAIQAWRSSLMSGNAYGAWTTVGERGSSASPQVPSQRPVNVNQTIQAQPGMSESQVARIAGERLAFALRSA